MQRAALPTSALATLLDDFRTAHLNVANPNEAMLHLFSNDFQPGSDTVIGDFTEVSASWYTALVSNFTQDVYENPDKSVACQAPSLQFNWSGGDAPLTVYGWFITNQAGTVLLLAARLESPVVMQDLLSAVICTPNVSVPAIEQ